MRTFLFFSVFTGALLVLSLSCGITRQSAPTTTSQPDYTYLALGDSYTIGESVCGECNFPKQLRDSLNRATRQNGTVKIIAKTGWTTTDLLAAIDREKPAANYDLVTLLIGVNNQYQKKPFKTYQKEFPELLDQAIQFAQNDPARVIVVSIPDYAFTPYGRSTSNPTLITEELKEYDAFAKKISLEKGVVFQNITPITQRGIEDKKLVAKDGLHPSEKAYRLFVELLFPLALDRISK